MTVTPEDKVRQHAAERPSSDGGGLRGARLVGAVPPLSGALAGLIAGAHLAAWLAGAMSGRGVSVITMKTNTALCLLLLAIALVLLAKTGAGSGRRWAGRVCAGLALVVGVLTLSENLGGWNLGIDQLLATEAPGAMGMVSPNRMGSPASVSVILLGAALVLLGRQRARGTRRMQGLALGACVVGLLPTLGYLYGVQWLYGLARVSAIAWPTALSIVCLGVGVAFARPADALLAQVTARDAGGAVVRRLLVPMVLLPIALGWLQVTGVRFGLFDPAMGTALLILTFVVSLCALTWMAGRRGSRAAAELGEQKALLAVTLTSIGDAVIACDGQGRVTFLNAVGAALTGWTQQDAAGRPIQTVFRIIDEGTGQPAEDIVGRVLREGRVVALANHTALVTKDGAVIPIEDSAAPIRDESGTLSGTVLVFHDVTEKRRAQEALRQSEEKFAKAFHGNTSIMAITRLGDGTFVDVNDRYLEVTGFARHDIVGRSSRELHVWKHPDARETFARTLAEDGQIHNTEYVFVKGDGTEWTGLVSSQVSELAGDQIVISSIVDITERKRAEDALRDSEARLKAALASMTGLSQLYAVLSKVNEAIVRTSDPLALYRDVCRIVAEDGQRPLVWIGIVDGRAVTPVAASGRSSDYVRGLRVETDGEFGHGPTGTCIREGRAVLNDDFDVNPDTRPWREAARQYGLKASAAFPLRHQGAVIGALTLYGIEPGTFDQEQVRLLEALSADVWYALDKMWQEQALHESERSLREADRRKDEFLAMLSHELRNPLAPIRSGIYILEHAAPGSEEARRAHAVIDRQVAHMTRLVDDLLDVTRISRGKILLQCETVDLVELVQRVVEDHRSAFTANDIHLHVTLSDGPMRIHADRTRMVQVVGNLLHNASKFTPAGGEVALSLEADRTLGHALVRLRDNGAGIEPEMLSRIFEPFTQGDTSLDRSRGGLGLGLALVKGLVELHEGQVTVSSEGAGRGTEFVVRLPLDAAANTPQPGPGTVPCRPRRVLIIEDNADAAESLQVLLEFGGHSVRVASNGPDGLSAARAFRPEVVLCDIGLPGMDGFDVARAFRGDPALGGIVLVALSGYAQQEDVQRALAAGFHRHLAKPASPEMVERMLVDLAPAAT